MGSMMRFAVSALCVLAVYLTVLFPFTRSMAQKPYAVKLGIIPHPVALQVLLPDFQELLGARVLGKVIQYYGSLTDDKAVPGKVPLAADYPAMSRTVHAALRLDPYNMDGYYFAQSILVWDVHQYRLATDLLEYGMTYRNWDWYLPFFAGFNYAFFLKDYENAAKMYMRAGELSDAALFKSLAGRYLQEAGETRMAIDYLRTLQSSARNPAVKRSLQVRIDTFEAVLAIEHARDCYLAENQSAPQNIDALIEAGYLADKPVDLYGGEFYFDERGQVRSTSKFAFAGVHRSDVEEKPAPPRGK